MRWKQENKPITGVFFPVNLQQKHWVICYAEKNKLLLLNSMEQYGLSLRQKTKLLEFVNIVSTVLFDTTFKNFETPKSCQ